MIFPLARKFHFKNLIFKILLILDRFSGGKFIPPSMRDDAPLAGILHDERLDKIDPRC